MDASDWMKGIFFSVVASVIGAGSKLAIRKSWLMEEDQEEDPLHFHGDDEEDELQHGQYRGPTWEEISQAPSSPNPNEPDEPQNDSPPQSPQQPQSQPSRNSSHGDSHRGIYTAVESDQGDETVSMELESTTLTSAQLPRWSCKCCCTIPQLLRFAGMIGMTFLNPAFCLLAMNYASPSILAPFSGLTLVWVIVLSQPLIGEQPNMAQKIACMLIVVGEVMVAVFGDHTNDDDSTRATVEASYRELAFIMYFVGLALWMGLLTLLIQKSSSPTLKRFAWGTTGGSVTGLAQCFIKDSLMVVKATSSLSAMPWYVPLFLLMGMLSSFGGLLLLTATMKRYDATYSAAMFVGSFVVSTSVMSAVHYHTFEHLADITDCIMYPMGLIILMIGVSILVKRGIQIHSSPRERRAYSDVMTPDDPYNPFEPTQVVVIPDAVSDKRSDAVLTERTISTSNDPSTHPSNQAETDDLELI